jgi:hypothetical protein
VRSRERQKPVLWRKGVTELIRVVNVKKLLKIK